MYEKSLKVLLFLIVLNPISVCADWYGFNDGGYSETGSSGSRLNSLFVLGLLVGFAYILNKLFTKKTADRILLSLTFGIPYYVMVQSKDVMSGIVVFVTIGFIAMIISGSLDNE